MVQEIDIATGDVVFEWDSLDHVPVTETQGSFVGGTAEGATSPTAGTPARSARSAFLFS